MPERAERACKECGTVFVLKRKNQFYCCKRCRWRARLRRYRERHPGRRAEQLRRYYEQNREQVREYCRSRREQHADHERRRRERHPEKVAEQQRRCRERRVSEFFSLSVLHLESVIKEKLG